MAEGGTLPMWVVGATERPPTDQQAECAASNPVLVATKSNDSSLWNLLNVWLSWRFIISQPYKSPCATKMINIKQRFCHRKISIGIDKKLLGNTIITYK